MNTINLQFLSVSIIFLILANSNTSFSQTSKEGPLARQSSVGALTHEGMLPIIMAHDPLCFVNDTVDRVRVQGMVNASIIEMTGIIGDLPLAYECIFPFVTDSTKILIKYNPATPKTTREPMVNALKTGLTYMKNFTFPPENITIVGDEGTANTTDTVVIDSAGANLKYVIKDPYVNADYIIYCASAWGTDIGCGVDMNLNLMTTSIEGVDGATIEDLYLFFSNTTSPSLSLLNFHPVFNGDNGKTCLYMMDLISYSGTGSASDLHPGYKIYTTTNITVGDWKGIRFLKDTVKAITEEQEHQAHMVCTLSCFPYVDLGAVDEGLMYEIHARPPWPDIPVVNALSVEYPNGGEQWGTGSTYTIRWWSTMSENVKIELLKGNVVQTTIISSTPNDGSHTWNIPPDFAAGTDYSIRVTSVGDTVTDVSNAYFTITAPSITVTNPDDGKILYAHSSYTVTWNSIGSFANVRILFSPDSGSNWYTIISSTSNDGAYSWKIPDSLSSKCKIQICDASTGTPVDESDGVFTIELLPTITISSPNGSEKLISGSLHTITWAHTSIVGDVKIEYSTNNGSSWTIIENSTTNDGIHPWTVPDVASTNCLIRISEASDNEPVDESDAVFIIEAAQALTVTSPNGGETFEAGTSVDIYWGSVGTVGDIKILFSPDNGSNWYTAVSSTANDGIHPWTVPDSISTKCKIQVTEALDGNPVDESDSVFTIVSGPVITVTSPNGDETWFVDSSYTITWEITGIVGNVKIEYSTNGGADWAEIVASTINDSLHQWTVKTILSTNCKIKVSDASDGFPSDESDGVFSIEKNTAIKDQVESIPLGTGFSAYPNPVETGQDITFYFTPASNASTAELKIYDQVGNVLFESDRINLQSHKNNHQSILTTWNLKNIPGRAVAEGTFLAILSVKDSDGKADVLMTLIGIKDNH
jgi:hypothetical protein